MRFAIIPALVAAALIGGGAITVAQTADNDAFTPETPAATSYATKSDPMTLVLDARDTWRGLMYAHMTIPVKSGPFTFVYPKWIPGEHGPTGPLANISQIRVSANGHTLPWHRDVVDLYAFHVDVPSGV